MTKKIYIYERDGGDGEKPVLIIAAISPEEAAELLPKNEYSPWSLTQEIDPDTEKPGVVFHNYLL